MRDALLQDLAGLPNLTILATHDNRLPPAPAIESKPIPMEDDIWEVWRDCMQQSDAVWLIAPESGGILARLVEIAEEIGKVVIGSPSHVISLTSSKQRTLQMLGEAGISIVPVIGIDEAVHGSHERIVAKPDDGAGCESTYCFSDKAKLGSWINMHHTSHILQPYKSGKAGSLSMLCKNGRAWLLSCNEQKVSLKESNDYSIFTYHGSVINGLQQYWEEIHLLAEAIAKALPAMQGYIGVDFIVDENTFHEGNSHEDRIATLHVLEINPRLTTSYTGLASSIGYNPARLILDLFYNPDFSMPPLNRNPVEVSVHA